MEEEIWKTIEEFPDYQVSNLGRVKGGRWGNIFKGVYDKDNYKRISIYDVNKKQKTKAIHRLVATTFISNPLNKPCVDHINRIKDDNRIDNLRWVTHKENEDNKKRGKVGEKYIYLVGKKFRVNLLSRPIFDTLVEAITYRDSILNQNPLEQEA
jgi:hypothetical protein